MKGTKRFLIVSFTGLMALSIIMLIWFYNVMAQKSYEAFRDIGGMYMDEMSSQFLQKYTAIADLYLSQLQGLVKQTNPEDFTHSKENMIEMASNASASNFTCLALYAADGEREMLYGKAVNLYEPESFFSYLEAGENRVADAYDENGEKYAVFGINAAYKMESGNTSCAIVMGIPMAYIENALQLEGGSELMYAHIIHRDGSFVVETSHSNADNYFNHILNVWEEHDGKTPQDYQKEFQEAINGDNTYSAMIMVEGQRHYVFGRYLPESDWYMVSVMPNGNLDDTITRLGNQRVNVLLTVCIVLMAAMLSLFVLYYRMTQKQIRQLDAARKEADYANQAKSQFLSSMSHDIRTPMNGIVGMTTIAMANIHDTARVQDCLQKISLSSKHLLGLINDVLDMAKIESGKMTLNMDMLSLSETMDNIVSIIQPQVKERAQHFDVLIQNIEAEDVYCDSVRLNQVLINLLSNAVKFTPEHGSINIYLAQEASPLGDDYVRCHFRVKDNGIGMTQEFLGKVFDTFAREDNARVERTEGTGLGMPITKSIVEAMKGTIEVESEVNKGTEFHIILDLKKAETKIEDMVLPSWNMLVVDNNKDLCESAVAALKEIGINADHALSGAEAVELAKKHHSEKNAYQIILLDWKMPEMDGVETTRELRKCLGEDIPILIISAYDWSDIEEEARGAGVQGFISKPLFKSNLFLGLSPFMLSEHREEALESPEKIDFSGKRILLAEDNDLNWEIAQEILSSAGFELERAENGQVCVEIFSASEQGYYDVILMDLRMPIMNGYDAATAIRALERPDAQLPIIAMTADAFYEDAQRCLECGMNAHIAKPIDVQLLIQQLEKYLK